MHFRRFTRSGTVVLASLALCATGCAGTEEPGPGQQPGVAMAASSPDNAVRHVIAISVDGLNPAAIRRLGRDRAPSLRRMLAYGAGTLNARTAREQTRTLPNHTGMVTGRRIGTAKGHRVTVNSDTGGTVHGQAGHYVASVFDVVHDHGGTTALYSAKDKFELLNRSWDGSHGAPDTTGADDGRDKIDRYVVGEESDNVTLLLDRLGSSPDTFSFVHLAQPDAAGHASGFMSRSYLTAVRKADQQVGRILDAVRADPGLRAHTTVVLTADHGGGGATHSDRTSRSSYTIPFLTWGVGAKKGAGLYALNRDRRRHPGTARTSYDGRQPIRNIEVANLVTDLLDLPDVRGSGFNSRRHLRIR
jgi:hypothetical protein